ncbi:hypothetical protein MTR67_039063 [Solanum verrucosum]|uniref:Uncharacterized protein n=1 Tax=Solanum verrucosum TaxID=315347 RepID=A0AAF0ZQ23_SOLVR|nr:hypothetical protein MTR67_039063 [Solanum verrucosum]
MISKSCIYQLVWVKDMDLKTPTIEFVPVVNEFLKVFPDDLPRAPPVRDVHRLAQLGVQLVDSTKGGVMVHDGSKSSFVSDMKANQDLDPTLVELKEAVLEKSIEVFYQLGNGVMYQGHSCDPNVDDLREKILS